MFEPRYLGCYEVLKTAPPSCQFVKFVSLIHVYPCPSVVNRFGAGHQRMLTARPRRVIAVGDYFFLSSPLPSCEGDS